MIVIPMVGRSRRFAEAGYAVPKYRLYLEGCSVFALAVGSFLETAQSEGLLVICLRDGGAVDFARSELARLGLNDARVVELHEMTRGQADTVYQGLELAGVPESEPLTIFNVDTFRPHFRYPNRFDVHRVDGYLECFIGSGANWSNVVPAGAGSDRVARTSEKMQESEYCCTGLYHFGSAAAFRRAYAAEIAVRSNTSRENQGELFVAPIFNHLIAEGADIRFEVIERKSVIFCGVPNEYVLLQAGAPEEFIEYARDLGRR